MSKIQMSTSLNWPSGICEWTVFAYVQVKNGTLQGRAFRTNFLLSPLLKFIEN